MDYSFNFQNDSSVTRLATHFLKKKHKSSCDLRIVTKKITSFISNPVLKLIIDRKTQCFPQDMRVKSPDLPEIKGNFAKTNIIDESKHKIVRYREISNHQTDHKYGINP